MVRGLVRVSFLAALGRVLNPNNVTAFTVVGSPKVEWVNITSTFTSGHTLLILVNGKDVISLSGTNATQGLAWPIPLQSGDTFYEQYQTGKVDTATYSE